MFVCGGRGGCHKKMDTSLSYCLSRTNDILIPCIGKAAALRAGKPDLTWGLNTSPPEARCLYSQGSSTCVFKRLTADGLTQHSLQHLLVHFPPLQRWESWKPAPRGPEQGFKGDRLCHRITCPRPESRTEEVGMGRPARDPSCWPGSYRQGGALAHSSGCPF